jgi:hypothetical protein
VGRQAFDQHVVIHREDPKRCIVPDQGHQACEVGKTILKHAPVRYLAAVQGEGHDLGQPGIQAVEARATRIARALDVLRLPFAQQRFVVEVRGFQAPRQIIDDFVAMTEASAAPRRIDLAQRCRRQPGDDLGVQLVAQGHPQFA